MRKHNCRNPGGNSFFLTKTRLAWHGLEFPEAWSWPRNANYGISAVHQAPTTREQQRWWDTAPFNVGDFVAFGDISLCLCARDGNIRFPKALSFNSHLQILSVNIMIYKIYVVALERKLSQRGPREELVSRGIMPGLCSIYCHQKFKSYLQCFNISVSFLVFQRSVLLRQLFLRERSSKEPR